MQFNRYLLLIDAINILTEGPVCRIKAGRGRRRRVHSLGGRALDLNCN